MLIIRSNHPTYRIFPYRPPSTHIDGNPTQWTRFLDTQQGDNGQRQNRDCGIVSVENILIEMGILPPHSNSGSVDQQETAVFQTALDNTLCESFGGTNQTEQVELLAKYGVAAENKLNINFTELATAVSDGRGVILSVDGQKLQQVVQYGKITNPNATGTHAVTVTGVKYGPNNSILGFYLCNSQGKSFTNYAGKTVYDSNEYVPIDFLKQCCNPRGNVDTGCCNAIITVNKIQNPPITRRGRRFNSQI